MSNPGIITEQGYPAGSFGFTEASGEDLKKLTPEEERERAKELGKELKEVSKK